MGSSCSCCKISFVAKSRGSALEKQELPRKHDVFVWKIDGFTSLLEEGEGPTNTSFKMLDMTWVLSLDLMDRKSGATDSEKQVSLHLTPVELCPNYKFETKVKIFILNPRDGEHIERQVSHTYMPTADNKRKVSCMIPLETLKSPSFGFLVEDSIVFGVEFIELKKVPWNGVEMISFMQKNKLSSGSCSWYIENFSQLMSRPYAYSNPFKTGEYTWRLRLKQENVSFYKNYIGLYLILDEKSGPQLSPSSSVMVEAVLSIKRQSGGVLTNDPLGTGIRDRCRFRSNFTLSSPSWGSPQFIRLDDLYNKSNGYLIKETCTIEASVRIIGYGI